MIAQSVILFYRGSKARRHVSGVEKGFRLPKHNEKGNDGSGKITYYPLHADAVSDLDSRGFAARAQLPKIRGQHCFYKLKT